MALQGTIETFALPDVMRLLASTRKTGCLRLTGSRGEGSIWVDGGRVVGSEASGAPHADSHVEVVFELLRFPDGDFVFDAAERVEATGPGADVEPVLAEAEQMLEEWRSIEAVVPSLESWVAMRPELDGDEVVIDRDRWRLLATIGSGTTVGRLGDALAMGELPVSRAVKGLVDAGLVTVGEPPAGFDEALPPVGVTAEPVVGVEPAAHETEPLVGVAPANGDGAAVEERFDPDALVIEPGPVVEEAPTVEAGEPAATAASDADALDAATIARQLMNLSPKTAKAVAAAAKATTDEERERALAEVDESDDVNRELLIKFLGSVNG